MNSSSASPESCSVSASSRTGRTSGSYELTAVALDLRTGITSSVKALEERYCHIPPDAGAVFRQISTLRVVCLASTQPSEVQSISVRLDTPVVISVPGAFVGLVWRTCFGACYAKLDETRVRGVRI